MDRRQRVRRGRRRGRRRRGWFGSLSVGAKIAVCFVGVFLCFLTTGVLFVAAKLGKIEQEDIPREDIVINAEIEERLEDLGTGYLNVALFGVDSRDGDLAEGTRTDCIIIASLNKETKEVRMASVYRDTLLDLSEGTLQKCNAAYSYGGAKMAINMLNMNLDLDIQDYVTVDFAAIAGAIDLLGGIDINVLPEEVDPMNKYIAETAKVAEKQANYIEGPGMQHLDGVQATTYARIRSTAGGDFTRTERQRVVIQKIVEKVQMSDLSTINKIIDIVFPKVSTSFSVTEILKYARYFADYKLGENTGFPIDKTTDTIAEVGSIVIPVDLEDNVRQLHQFLFGTSDYSPSSTVRRISGNITARVGRQNVSSNQELSTQIYEADPKEGMDYTGGDNVTGSNNGTGSDNSWSTEGTEPPDTGDDVPGETGNGTEQEEAPEGAGSEETGQDGTEQGEAPSE